MAEHAIYIVPDDPDYLPDAEKRNMALEYFRKISPLPNANGSYYFYTYDKPSLFDAGEALEKITCPKCDEEINIYDEDDWWDEAQDSMASDPKEPIQMPCCGESARPIYFKFDAPSHFARFGIGALEPSMSKYWEDERTLKKEVLDRFEKIVGCRVAVIWAVK